MENKYRIRTQIGLERKEQFIVQELSYRGFFFIVERWTDVCVCNSLEGAKEIIDHYLSEYKRSQELYRKKLKYKPRIIEYP